VRQFCFWRQLSILSRIPETAVRLSARTANPFSACVELVKQLDHNLRAVLQEIDSGAMLA